MLSAKTGKVLNKERLTSEEHLILGYLNTNVMQTLLTAKKDNYITVLDSWRVGMYALLFIYKNNPDRQPVFCLPGLEVFKRFSQIPNTEILKDLIDYAYEISIAFYVDGILLESYEQTALKAAMKEVEERDKKCQQ